MLTLTTLIFYLKLVLNKGKVQTFRAKEVFPEGLWQRCQMCDVVHLPIQRPRMFPFYLGQLRAHLPTPLAAAAASC